MLNRLDVERIVENVLKELSITVVSNNPNNKEIVLKYKDVVISSTPLQQD